MCQYTNGKQQNNSAPPPNQDLLPTSMYMQEILSLVKLKIALACTMPHAALYRYMRCIKYVLEAHKAKTPITRISVK